MLKILEWKNDNHSKKKQNKTKQNKTETKQNKKKCEAHSLRES